MRRVVDCGAVTHDVFGYLFSNSAFSTHGVYCAPYFVQPVLELRVEATSQKTHRHLILPLQPWFFSAVKLFSFHAMHPANSFMGDLTPSGSTPNAGLRRVVVVSKIFLIGCSSFSVLSLCHRIPHNPAVAWTSGERHQVPFIMEDSKEV